MEELPERVTFRLGHAEIERHPGHEIRFTVVIYDRSDLRKFALESIGPMDELDQRYFPNVVRPATTSHNQEVERAWIAERATAKWLRTYDGPHAVFRFQSPEDAFEFKMRFG
ncbi:MAG: hypothetical protein EOP83_31565 [Verrucomicrobiaceae bacterium]|nr:MAG: hypothetical protein EOP83_31565 [Verrucomicrobiaceae bacterium]